MHRSSQSIGNLAAALAKAQIELVNPEKSLTATIKSAGAGAWGADLQLCLAVERARYCPQDARPA